MADQRTARRTIKNLQRIQTWQLVALLILAGFIAATFLRLNNIGMVERRSAVLNADQEGNDDITIQRLYDLQRYVSAHMNTNLGNGIYLESSYKKDVQAAYDAALADQNENGNIYQKAQDICGPQFGRWSPAYVQCTVNELEKYPSGSQLVSQVNKPDPDLYRHDFASPVWSPDFAGWSLVVCALIALLIIARLVGLGILQLILRRHYKSI